jgi:molybdate transport system ATP-binding protein
VLLWVPLLDSALGSRLRVRIPAREVILALVEPGLTSVHNVFAGRVRAITQDAVGHIALVEVVLPDRGALLARVTLDAIDRLALAIGKDVVALVKSTSIEVLPG